MREFDLLSAYIFSPLNLHDTRKPENEKVLTTGIIIGNSRPDMARCVPGMGEQRFMGKLGRYEG